MNSMLKVLFGEVKAMLKVLFGEVKAVSFAFAIFIGTCALFCVSCSDFFDPDPDDIINEKDYLATEDEMYKAFLGILSRVQDAGDHSIILTDTRCNVIETTENAPTALQNIYNYSNTEGNEYADPTCYYAIITACNDYFDKMGIYHNSVGGMSETAETNFSALLSMTIRLKVWAYLKLGSIYGVAYWFDDPLEEAIDFSNTSVFTRCDVGELATKAIDLLDNGIDVDGVHIDSETTINWATWFDEENSNEETLYTKWYYLVPPRILLEAEFRSWRASYETEEVAQADWLWIRDNLLKYIYDIHSCGTDFTLNPSFDFNSSDDQSRVYNVYQMGMTLQSGVREEYFPYLLIFPTEEIGNKYQNVSSIMYDYTNSQTNRIVQYFCPEYPSSESYYLRPSTYGQSIYDDDDIRSMTQRIVMNQLGGKPCISKYYYYYDRNISSYTYIRDNIFEIQPSIPTFRGHDFHFLIAEAENHLGNWKQANAILNKGLLGTLSNKELPEDWSPYYATWLVPDESKAEYSTKVELSDGSTQNKGGYGNIGICGAMRSSLHTLPEVDENGNIMYNGQVISESERCEIFDWELADEYLKEFVAEGKSYSFLCKIGQRYASVLRGGNASLAREKFAARISPNHEGYKGRVNAWQDGVSDIGYFIKWDLKN